MRCDWRYERALWARGRASELRRRTPSILTAVSYGVASPVAFLSYSKANPNSGMRVLGAAGVCSARVPLQRSSFVIAILGARTAIFVVVMCYGVCRYDTSCACSCCR
jgi:hypothetical protein